MKLSRDDEESMAWLTSLCNEFDKTTGRSLLTWNKGFLLVLLAARKRLVEEGYVVDTKVVSDFLIEKENYYNKKLLSELTLSCDKQVSDD